MFRTFLFGGLALIGSLAAVSPSDASNNLGRPGRSGYPGLRNQSFLGNQFRAFGYVVQFRQMQMRVAQFYDRGEAFRFSELQRQRGFETNLCQERGLWVVHYRMCDWHNFRSVGNGLEANQLERMLEQRGFDARVLRM